MEKKKVILVIILFVIACVLGGLLIRKKSNSNDNKEVIQSNVRDDKLEQLEITNDEINIRSDADTKSEKIGKVLKGEIYTILEIKEDNYYTWYKIKTNSDVEGFIAGKYKTEDEVQEYVKLLEVTENNKE